MLQRGAHFHKQKAVVQKYFSLQEYVLGACIVERKGKLMWGESLRVSTVSTILNLKMSSRRRNTSLTVDLSICAFVKPVFLPKVCQFPYLSTAQVPYICPLPYVPHMRHTPCPEPYEPVLRINKSFYPSEVQHDKGRKSLVSHKPIECELTGMAKEYEQP